MSRTETPAPPSQTSRSRAFSPGEVSPVPQRQVPVASAVTAPVERTAAHGAASADAHAHDPHDEMNWGEIQRPNKGGMILVGAVVAVLLAVVFLVGYIPRHSQADAVGKEAAEAKDGSMPVNVTRPTRAPAIIDISVPGSLRPWQEVSVFARTSGYLKKWYADISNQVKEGQLLAEIDSPTVDQQLKGAQASLGQSKANVEKARSDAELQKVTLQRYQDLTKTQSITQQQLDQQRSTYDVAVATVHAMEATLRSDEANVAKLEQMQSFEKVTAPFAGVITARPYDTGSLIIADPSDVNVKAMYKIAENDVVRVFVNVPQSDALAISKGMDVKVTTRERPGHTFIGKVMGTTNYLDAETRSLLTEIKVPNEEGLLLPGMYVLANFTLNRIQPPLMVNAPSMVINAEGDQVAVVKDGKVHFQPVKMGRDFGSTIEITEGLTGDEQIIANPNERTIEGAAVTAIGPAPEAATPAPPQRTASVK